MNPIAETNSTSVSVGREVSDRLWVLIVAGIPTGAVVAGVGSRLAMFVLRLSSPDNVIGVTSDDGFEIGRLTLGGSYNLLSIGAMVGVIGVAAYRAVAPWLLGPRWFRRLTVAAAAGAVVGSMLVHADGIDFHALKPLWFAVGLFVALPALFGVAIAFAVDWATGISSSVDWRRWIVPVLLLAVFPFTIPLVVIAGAVLVAWVPLHRILHSAGGIPVAAGVVMRAVWLAIAVSGLFALVGDVRALT